MARGDDMTKRKVDDQIAEMIRGRIKDYQEDIKLLKIELSRYDNPDNGKKAASRSRRRKSSEPSIRERVIKAITASSKLYRIEELRKIVNFDGGKEISKPTFTSTHSRLVGTYCKFIKQDSPTKPAYYKKIEKEEKEE